MSENHERRPERPGVLLEDLTWHEAESVLSSETVVVLPIGASAKEHGCHLLLKNDFLIAEWLKARVLEKCAVVVAPTINYSFYPAFLEYPGSTSLRFETARDMVVDIVRTLARHGPRRFYALNTGVSTRRPLEAAAEALSQEGILLRFTDIISLLGPIEKSVAQQEGGTHADEIETSMMLVIAPETVDMSKATKDYNPGEGGLTRDPGNSKGCYSPTGAWGDPTLATREKGEKVLAAYVAGVVSDIESLRALPR